MSGWLIWGDIIWPYSICTRLILTRTTDNHSHWQRLSHDGSWDPHWFADAIVGLEASESWAAPLQLNILMKISCCPGTGGDWPGPLWSQVKLTSEHPVNTKSPQRDECWTTINYPVIGQLSKLPSNRPVTDCHRGNAMFVANLKCLGWESHHVSSV